MKKPIEVRGDSKRTPASAQQKPRSKKNVRLRVSEPLRRAIEEGAKRENVTISEFVNRAIREALSSLGEQH
jgi:predicted HicB family RNase H-like nuclease